MKKRIWEKTLASLLAVCLFVCGLPLVASAAWSTNYTLTGNQAQDIVNVAVAQSGKNGSNLGYSADWCAYFVTDCAKKADITNFPKEGYASSLFRVMTQWGMEGHYFTDVAAQNSAWTGGKGNGITGFDIQYCTGISSSSWNPRIGDIVFFTYKGYGTISHVAIVRQVSGNRVTLVHGNWSGKVNTSTTLTKGAYQKAGSQTIAICAYVRPSYTNSNLTPTSPPTQSYPTVQNGSRGEAVKTLQNMLNAVQGSNLTVDGIFGSGTKAAVQKFQRNHGLTADGICGPKTWAALQKAYNVGVTSAPWVSVNGQTVTASWSYSGSADYIDVCLIKEPWGWYDIVETKSITGNSCTFYNVSPGYYQIFTIARPNSDTAQSEWTPFTVQAAHTSHNWNSGVVTTAATETSTGVKTYTCTVCGATKTETIDKLPHSTHKWNEGKITTEPTLSSYGIKTYTCSICGTEKTEEIPKLEAATTTVTSDKTKYNLDETVNFSWTPIKGAESYFVQVKKDMGDWNASIHSETVVGKTTYSYPAGAPGDYFLEVQATDGHGNMFPKAYCFYTVVDPDAQDITVNIYVFVDVSADAYYADAVNWAVENAVTSGTSATTFSPQMTCTRAQAVTFLWRAVGSPEPTAAKNPFTDIDSSDYYYKAVLWAVENGVTSGTSATTFSPNKVCSRAEIVTFLWRAAKEPEPEAATDSFVDVKSESYYSKAAKWAAEENITSGTDKTHFSPDGKCTRAQTVTFLYRYAN